MLELTEEQKLSIFEQVETQAIQALHTDSISQFKEDLAQAVRNIIDEWVKEFGEE